MSASGQPAMLEAVEELIHRAQTAGWEGEELGRLLLLLACWREGVPADDTCSLDAQRAVSGVLDAIGGFDLLTQEGVAEGLGEATPGQREVLDAMCSSRAPPASVARRLAKLLESGVVRPSSGAFRTAVSALAQPWEVDDVAELVSVLVEEGTCDTLGEVGQLLGCATSAMGPGEARAVAIAVSRRGYGLPDLGGRPDDLVRAVHQLRAEGGDEVAALITSLREEEDSDADESGNLAGFVVGDSGSEGEEEERQSGDDRASDRASDQAIVDSDEGGEEWLAVTAASVSRDMQEDGGGAGVGLKATPTHEKTRRMMRKKVEKEVAKEVDDEEKERKARKRARRAERKARKAEKRARKKEAREQGTVSGGRGSSQEGHGRGKRRRVIASDDES